MRSEEIEHLLEEHPMVPFRLHLTDGTSYDIMHPDMVLLTRSLLIVGVPIRQGTRRVERVHHISLLHVVRGELLDGQASAAS